MASPDGFHQFMGIPELGYYAKLLLLLAAAYLIGLVLDEIVTVVIGSILGLLTAWLAKTEERRKAIDNLALAVAPWRDASWQKMAASYLGPDLAPGPDDQSQWRSWYLIIKAGFPQLEEGYRRSAILMDAAQTSAWSLLIARIILPGHRYVIILVVLAAVCFVLAAVNKIMLTLVSFGYSASDLTGADLGAAMLREIRKEKLLAKQNP
jgi:small-conductance mechanosensitive channel